MQYNKLNNLNPNKPIFKQTKSAWGEILIKCYKYNADNIQSLRHIQVKRRTTNWPTNTTSWQQGKGEGGRVAKTCCQHSQREEGGNTTTESNQATNKCNKYDDKGSKKQQYEEEKEGVGGVVSSRGKDIGLAANEVAAAKGDLKTVA